MKTGHLDGQGLAELRNYNIQNLSSAPTTNLYAGRFYFNTTDNTLYVYDGTAWKDALKQGIVYTEGSGIDITGNVISADLSASDIPDLSATYYLASNPNGYTDNVGTVTSVNNTTPDASGNVSITIPTVNNAMLTIQKNGTTVNTFTANASSDVTANISVPTKISDLTDDTSTNPVDKADTLTNLTATVSELNIMDGVTVTASDINSVTSKIGLSNLSIDSGSSNYLGYDNATGKFSAKVDTTVTANSSKLITSGAVQTAINNAIAGGMVYKGEWTATGQTDYSSITLPVKAGYMYLVSGSATIGGIEWNTDDYLVINVDVPVGGTITDVKKIDNTEGSDIVRLNATQTLTNKTIDADDNTISDLTTSNFKSGVVVTSVGSTGADTSIPTEKAVRSAIKALRYSAQNGALTASAGGICTWTVTHNLATSDVLVDLYEVSTGDKVLFDYSITNANSVSIKILSASNISADTYKVVIKG